MKIMRTKYILMIILSSVSFFSCTYLDYDETNNLKTKEDMYKYFGSTESMLTHVYTFMPQDFGVIENAMRASASDDAEFGSTGAIVQIFNTGNWSPVKTTDTAWSLYKGVRAANSFIEEIAKVDFSRYENDASYKNWMKKLKNFPYEARVLRAHYFFELARRYGDIAMPLTVLDQNEASTFGKTKFADVINFIVSECSEAANNLPLNYENEPDKQVGRVTKGFAMAVKSKALLYAASKLHNPLMDVDAWKKSAKAAQDLIEIGVYSLDTQESANNIASKEVVLMRMNSENLNFENLNFPLRFTEGNRSSYVISESNYPSQNLVDAFETINGYSVTLEENGWISDDPNFNSQFPYDNRDPRFSRVVLANGMEFKESTIETFIGGKDDAVISQGGSPTGYFLKKYIQESTSFAPDHLVPNKHHWVIYRYAETLLTYAESMINAFNDPTYVDGTYKYSALWAINQVRANAGMPAITTTNKDEFMNRLYNEWRVEFAFEDHRFWDVRRWKIADKTQRELYGVKIETLPNGKLQFFRNLYETRTWKDCMYLYPIPQDELFKNTNLNPQNSGW